MFTPEQREQLRDALVAAAEADERVVGAALTGSAALDNADRWSDIDLILGVDPADRLRDVIDDFTRRMQTEHGAIHHLDLVSRRTVYRVFFLDSTLQVDLAFAPAEEFGAVAPSFRLLFGQEREQPQVPTPDATPVIGWAWLYALHARSSLERGKLWQAEHMIAGVRERVLMLACLRHGRPAHEARGVDDLPAEFLARLEGSLASRLDAEELRRAFGVVTRALADEIQAADPDMAERIGPTVLALCDPE